MPKVTDPKVLVGLDGADDAAVYQVGEDLAIVQSVDFFTPIVDDPYTFGRIAAVNALSDIYAMGGEPLFALNLVAFPSKELPGSVLEEILKGGSDAACEAGISILGGHSIDDAEPKYGMSVTGSVAPDGIIKNSSARAGDYLVLTKPIGIGIITTAIKNAVAGEKSISEAIKWMTTLNRTASKVMVTQKIEGATDITGFGLLGHLYEMVLASKVGAVIEAEQVPLIKGTMNCLNKSAYPGGSLANLEFVSPHIDWNEDVSDETRKILCDAQTSGGLLICIPEEKMDTMKALFSENEVFHCTIGRICESPIGRIRVTGSVKE